MCILILRVAGAKILSVASSLHAVENELVEFVTAEEQEYEEVIEEYEEVLV